MKKILIPICLLLVNFAYAYEIPKKIHFIWVGPNPLRTEYLKNILSIAYRNPDYEATIWMQNPHFFEQALSRMETSRPRNIVVRDVREGYEGADQYLVSIIRRESSGTFANYAAASDLIRVLVLIKHGGIYIDTDIRARDLSLEHFNENASDLRSQHERDFYISRGELLSQYREMKNGRSFSFRFNTIDAPRGILVYSHIVLSNIALNNSILASIPQHPFLIDLIEQMKNKYLAADQANVANSWVKKRKLKHVHLGQVGVEVQNLFRNLGFRDSVWVAEGGGDRFNMTRDFTGPNILTSNLLAYIFWYFEKGVPLAYLRCGFHTLQYLKQTSHEPGDNPERSRIAQKWMASITSRIPNLDVFRSSEDRAACDRFFLEYGDEILRDLRAVGDEGFGYLDLLHHHFSSEFNPLKAKDDGTWQRVPGDRIRPSEFH